MSTQNQQQAPAVPNQVRTRPRRLLTVLAAGAAGVSLWAFAVPLLGVELAARPGGGAVMPIGVLAVVVTSLLTGLAGWLSLALLERWTTRARLIWRVVAVVVLVLSLLGPLSAVTLPATVVLLGLHVVVGAILIAGLPRRQET